MFISDNYPTGAEFDPSAPWNEETKKVEVYISLSVSRPFTIEVGENENVEDWTSQEIIDAVKEQYPKEKVINDIENGSDWDIDEFIGY